MTALPCADGKDGMIRVYTVKEGTIRRYEPSRSELRSLSEQHPWIWVDLVGESLEDAERILEEVLGEPVELTETLSRPSPRFFKGCTLLVFPLSPMEDEHQRERTMQLIISPSLLATIRDDEDTRLVEQTAQTLENLSARMNVDIDITFSRLIDEATDVNEAALETARDSSEKVERSAMTVESKEVVEDVARLASRLGDLHDVLQRQRLLILDLLEGLLPGVGVKGFARSLLIDARHKVERQLDLVDRYDHELSGVISLSDLALTLRLTRVMTLLTVIATVLLLPNTVGTILGIPSLPIPQEAWSVTAAILIVSGVFPTWYAYKKGWLNPKASTEE